MHKIDFYVHFNILIQKGIIMAENKKWIQNAISKPGALHQKLHIPENETIPTSVLNEAAKKGGTLGKEARLAKTLKKLSANKRK